ncbi:MAG: nitrate/nitrite transporter NrtS [Pseudomonadota bacterium]
MQQLTYFSALTHPITVKRGLKIGAFVGTILVLINHADALLLGITPPLWNVLLTYLVRYSVSSDSTAAFMIDSAKPQE